MPGPLDGIRILDFTRYQQGAYATAMLSDLGADVLKVESRDGDPGRLLWRSPDGWCAYFEAHNRNKRSITVDLRKPEGREIILKLLPRYNVVTDNFRTGVMARLGLDYESLRKVEPQVITGSASGFGAVGPYTGRPSFDSIGQAMGGLMSVQGGGPDEPPMDLMGGLADQVGAMVFALGIASAVIARERQGIGQHVDVSLLGSQVALQAFQLTGMMRTGVQDATPRRWLPTFTHYPCADGRWISVGAYDPKWWEPLCRTLEREDLIADERFVDLDRRQENRPALLAELDATFEKRPLAEWLDLLVAADIPCGPVHDHAGVVSDPQILANGYITSMEHPTFGKVGVVGTPIKLSRTPAGPKSSAPELGQHTEGVLLDLGYSQGEIGELRAAEVI